MFIIFLLQLLLQPARNNHLELIRYWPLICGYLQIAVVHQKGQSPWNDDVWLADLFWK